MNIALIAHDNKKILMENLCIAYRHILNKHTILATGSTGTLVEETANLSIHKFLPGHLGGEQQLGSQIINDEVDLLIFLRDPTYDKDYDDDTSSILRLCDRHNIPLASNLSTAEALLLALDRGDLDWREIMKK